MQFRHPELLYALLLLVIPILVHLFQLRRFKEERFTNVAFLKKIQLQTRKSNTIKKWLILFCRMAALAMLVLAFAQPFFTETDTATRSKETVIYLDNSFSMQAKGASGQLLRAATQDLISNIDNDEKVTILTNTKTYRQTTIDNVRNELIQLKYTPLQLSEDAVTLRALKEFSNKSDVEKRIVYISDFQGNDPEIQPDTIVSKHYVQLSPTIKNNVSIDSVFISSRTPSSFELTVKLSTQASQEGNTPVSIYNGDILLAKGTASFKEDLETEILFDIEVNDEIQGKISIEDPLLTFDNTLYFSINKNLPIKVLVINGSSSEYLSRIFTKPEFQFTATTVSSLDFSSIPDYNYIIVNELEELSSPLIDALSAFAKAGGTTTIILSPKGNLANYKLAAQSLGNVLIESADTSTKLVTSINYSHPIYKDVFENNIKNFQYPSVNKPFNVTGGDPILKFEDGTSFLVQNNGVYFLSGGIARENSNFTNSPLVVPTFYNMSRQSLQLPQLYFTIGTSNTYDIPATLQEDAILQLEQSNNPDYSLIPLQQLRGNKVSITTRQEPAQAGTYAVKLENRLIQEVSYNYSRNESILRYRNIEAESKGSYQNSVEALFTKFKTDDTVQYLWKWFIIFTLFFLLLEIAILKFYK